MEKCIFCQIVKGEIPSYKVYEDDLFLAFLDISPRTKGHTLVIPKKHYRWVYEVPEFSQYWEATLKVTQAILKALTPQFVNYFTYGLEVPHAHIHVLPRYGEMGILPEAQKIASEEMKEIEEKIKKHVK